MKKKESYAVALFMTCIIAWLLVVGITPVGGWNPNSSTYNAVFKQLFAITGLCSLGSLVTLLFILNQNNEKSIK